MNAARTAVLRGLAGADRPLDAEELRLEAARFHPVSRATVSRTLTFLRVAGVARPLPRTEGRTLYEIISGGQEAPAALHADDAGRSAPPPQKDGAGEDVSIEALAAVLRAGGYQMNPERVAILRAFVSAGRPVHAEELLAETRRHISVSRATVSRTLKLFHQVGVARLAARDRKRCYYSPGGPAHGVVLVDETSGAVRQIEAARALKALHLTLAQAGFVLSEGVEVRVRPISALAAAAAESGART